MTRDEILTAYEDAWRANALQGRKQFRGLHEGYTESDPGDFGGCAWIAPKYHGDGDKVLRDAAAWALLTWRCECGVTTLNLSGVMQHLNDKHRWDWMMFANKFRDVLAEGETRSAAERP